MKFALLTLLLLLSNLAHSGSLLAGNKSIAIKVGASSTGGENYTVAGANFQYFAIDNLAVGAGFEYWFSGKPTISKASLDATYYLSLNQQIKPYLGVLYSHYFVEGLSDIDAYGYRLGVSYMQAPMRLSIGMKQEKYFSSRPLYFDQDPTIEFMASFSF